MAQHDPDSAVHEESIALKLGRQHRIEGDNKTLTAKIEYINGQDDEDEEDEEDEEEEEADMIDQSYYVNDKGQRIKRKSKEVLVNVEGEDGQQYVVLEVIQESDHGGENEEEERLDEENDPMDVDDGFMLSSEGKRLRLALGSRQMLMSNITV